MEATPLNLANHPTHVVLDLGCTRLIGSRAAIGRFNKHAWYCGITKEFCVCNKSFVFANSETETCKESCIIHFPKIPPCSTKVVVLETGDVPILFSLSQMKKLGTVRPKTHSELIPWARKLEFESCKLLKTRSDSELSKKNGGQFVRKGFFFFETFWANSSGGFEGSETFFTKKTLLSSFSLFNFSFIFPFIYSLLFCFIFSLFFILSLFLSCFFSLLVFSLLFSCLSSSLSLFSSLLFSSLLFSSLLFSSLLFSSLLFSFSSLLFSSLLFSFSSLLFSSLLFSSHLVSSSLVFSCLVSLFLCLLSLSSFSVSLSPCDVVCCVVWVCVVVVVVLLVVVVCVWCVCVCVCCGTLKKT